MFPAGQVDDNSAGIRITFIAEGFPKEDRRVFMDACSAFVDHLLQFTPFNLLRLVSAGLSIYAHFIESANRGPAINTVAAPNRTAFESSFSPSSNDFSINLAKVADQLEDLIITEAGEIAEEEPVSLEDEHQAPGLLDYDNLFRGSLVVFLLPQSDSYPMGIEMEFTPSENKLDPWFIATSLTGLWHQVVIRAICKLLGLGDEYVNDDPAYDTPSPEVAQGIENTFYNLVRNVSSPPSDNFKWYPIISPTRQGFPLTTHRHPESNVFASGLSATSDQVELWEGGGGYQTGIYRSARDCLLRRKIGDPSLPLRNEVVPLCPACEHHIKTTLLPFY